MTRAVLLSLLSIVLMLLLTAEPALAAPISPVAADELASSCAKAGGEFFHISRAGRNSWSCEKKNCDGKGGTCSVDCDESGDITTCEGTTPAALTGGQTPLSLLQNGKLRASPLAVPRR